MRFFGSRSPFPVAFVARVGFFEASFALFELVDRTLFLSGDLDRFMSGAVADTPKDPISALSLRLTSIAIRVVNLRAFARPVVDAPLFLGVVNWISSLPTLYRRSRYQHMP